MKTSWSQGLMRQDLNTLYLDDDGQEDDDSFKISTVGSSISGSSYPTKESLDIDSTR